jgi:hypothetical protein
VIEQSVTRICTVIEFNRRLKDHNFPNDKFSRLTFYNDPAQFEAFVEEVAKNPGTSLGLLKIIMDAPTHTLSNYIVELATRKYHDRVSAKNNDETIKNQKIMHRDLSADQVAALEIAISKLPNKDTLSWGTVSQILQLPQKPRIVQKEVLRLKTKNNTVSRQELVDLISSFKEGKQLYELGLSSYSGFQTMHPLQSTRVLQLNITEAFNKELLNELSPAEFRLWQEYHAHLTSANSGHPTESSKTVAWVRVTELNQYKTLVVEELQCDVLAEKNFTNTIGEFINRVPAEYGYFTRQSRKQVVRAVFFKIFTGKTN